MDQQKMGGGEAAKPSRSKMPEKPPAETYREYLDMDTDEEEFGRQETPEPLDEAPPEPDKPDFTDEELDTLVAQVKSLTVLANLSESSWTEECSETVREYFREPAVIALVVYFSGGVLRAQLGFPSSDDGGMAYFLREPWQVYRAEDFLATVVFGSVSGSTVRTALKVLGGLYAPLVFRHQLWPTISRDEIFSNVNDLLALATDLTYSPSGVLILYTPWEGGREISASPGDQETLANRLEKVARTWIRQIREALLVKIVPPSDELFDLDDELNYWRSRYTNTTGLSKQLEGDRVLAIVGLLKRARSPSVKELRLLGLGTRNARNQAESNLRFLGLVAEKCGRLTEPKLARDRLPEILHTVRFVWTKSAYYREQKNVERLLGSLSARVVRVCASSIDLRSIFDEPKMCRRSAKTSLRCCDSYSRIYDSILVGCLGDEDNWKTDKDAVFNCVNAFVQRCHDVIEISDAITMHGSFSKINLGGTRGSQHEVQYRRVKNRFAEVIDGIRSVCDCALDTRNTKWFDIMFKFRRDVAQLESAVKDLLHGLFEDVRDVDTGIETLYALLKFKDRRGFRDIFYDKWTQVWKLFYEDIKISTSASVDCELVQDKIKFLGSECTVTEVAVIDKYLSKLHKTMIDASDWLGDCDLQHDILKYFDAK